VENLEALVSNYVLADINLDPRAIALEVRKSCFPHQAVRNYPSGDTYLHFLCFEFRRHCRAILFHKVCSSRRPAKFVRVRVQARRSKLFQFLQPLFELVPRLKFQVGFLISSELSGSPSEYSGHAAPLATNLWFYFGTLLYFPRL
jgi:hypothetical protein